MPAEGSSFFFGLSFLALALEAEPGASRFAFVAFFFGGDFPSGFVFDFVFAFAVVFFFLEAAPGDFVFFVFAAFFFAAFVDLPFPLGGVFGFLSSLGGGVFSGTELS